MIRYIVKRLLISIPTLIGITLVTFVIMRLASGDPYQALSGGVGVKTSQKYREEFLKQYGFDKPIFIQYGMWFFKAFRLDFGVSLVHDRPVMQLVAEKLPVTVYLNLVSIIVIFLLSIPTGIKAALKKDQFYDKFFGVLFFILYSLFVPWVAIFLITIFSVKLNILPFLNITSDDFSYLPFFGKVWDVVKHSIMPVIVLSYNGLAFLSRITRGSMLEVLNQEYIVTARAKGLPEKVVIKKHAMRNALIPLITIFGSILPSLIGGSVIIEEIFQIDGMGRLFFSSVMSRDYFVIMGLSTITAVLTLIGILISDILYASVDPRIKFE